MIHYHGSPFGGSNVDLTRFFHGRHAFVPFPNPDNLPAIAEVCQSFALDNGAFTIWKKGDGRIDYDAYVQWVRKWHRHPGFDWAVIPDIIDGTGEENDEWVQRWPSDLKGVPVWHLHEPIDRLIRLSAEWEIVALGSSGEWSTPGAKKWWDQIARVLDLICDDDGRPPCKLHGLRALDPDVFTKLPLASADSVNASRNANQLNRYGIYTPPTSAQRGEVITERIEAHNSAPRWERVDQQEMFPVNGHR